MKGVQILFFTEKISATMENKSHRRRNSLANLVKIRDQGLKVKIQPFHVSPFEGNDTENLNLV